MFISFHKVRELGNRELDGPIYILRNISNTLIYMCLVVLNENEKNCDE